MKKDGRLFLAPREGLIPDILHEVEKDPTSYHHFKKCLKLVSGVRSGEVTRLGETFVRSTHIPISKCTEEIALRLRSIESAPSSSNAEKSKTSAKLHVTFFTSIL